MNNRKLAGAARSKTVWLGTTLTVLGALQAQMEMFTAFLTPSQVGMLGSGIGIVIIVLRAVTDSALDDRGR